MWFFFKYLLLLIFLVSVCWEELLTYHLFPCRWRRLRRGRRKLRITSWPPVLATKTLCARSAKRPNYSPSTSLFSYYPTFPFQISLSTVPEPTILLLCLLFWGDKKREKTINHLIENTNMILLRPIDQFFSILLVGQDGWGRTDIPLADLSSTFPSTVLCAFPTQI